MGDIMLSVQLAFSDDLLDRDMFVSLLKARVLVAEYVKEYNKDRPHSALVTSRLAQTNNRLSLRLVHNSGARQIDMRDSLENNSSLFDLLTIGACYRYLLLRFSNVASQDARRCRHYNVLEHSHTSR